MTELPTLDALDQRILGSLLEKQVTVPASYPLTLNALRGACNQSSSRDPVSDYDDATLEQGVRDLKSRDLVRVIWAGKGSRTLKHHELLSDTLGLDPDEYALLTVLLLRGPQAPGELKTRTERLHTFADRGAVEECLLRMSRRPAPLVAQLERQAGQREARWTHLLGPVDVATGGSHTDGGGIDLEVVLRDGGEARDSRVLAAYDAVADTYAHEFGDELEHKPFDRWLLARIAEAGHDGPILEVGCGPGHVAAELARSGAQVTGRDISARMIDLATAAHPEVSFEVGDLRRVMRPPTAQGWAAIVAWYALCHLAPSELPETIAGLARALRPGGVFALATHVGAEVRHADDWWAIPSTSTPCSTTRPESSPPSRPPG
ncbi:DUF480 domain-containing protein [Mobilicoccus caccae]|uniref:Methyltransferase domain-containing protein n=1 Tax=Mobilicoccus caccae TaxID=1859295 RepID=A0ABQ6IP67_9MICO|nr:DUF480 domain-containing protein [Mobilicoccus caccae]GMA38493.1 hypothetical protein GCM10025883_05380 [Mobilicoccus caccae]